MSLTLALASLGRVTPTPCSDPPHPPKSKSQVPNSSDHQLPGLHFLTAKEAGTLLPVGWSLLNV